MESMYVERGKRIRTLNLECSLETRRFLWTDSLSPDLGIQPVCEAKSKDHSRKTAKWNADTNLSKTKS